MSYYHSRFSLQNPEVLSIPGASRQAPAKLTVHSGHEPYLTSVRKDASSHLVVSLILLKSPSHIRGIKPESPCSGKGEGQQLSLDTKATESCLCFLNMSCLWWLNMCRLLKGTQTQGSACHPKPTTQGPSYTIPLPPELLPTLWNKRNELSNFYALRLWQYVVSSC